MIVLVSPKGWTGPKRVDGKKVEGTFRAHQVPLGEMREHPEHVTHARALDEELPAARALRCERAACSPSWRALAPKGDRRMGANPHANGGRLLVDLRLPDFRRYAVAVPRPGAVDGEATRVQGEFIRDVLKANAKARNFRVFSPDETASNRWNAVFEVTDRCSVARDPARRRSRRARRPRARSALRAPVRRLARGLPADAVAMASSPATKRSSTSSTRCSTSTRSGSRSRAGSRGARRSLRSTSCSPRTCGDRTTTASPTRIRASSTTSSTRRPRSSASTCRRTRTRSCRVTDHCLRSRHHVNVIVAGKQPAAAVARARRRDRALRSRASASGTGHRSDAGAMPDVVMACCGDVPTLETLAAVSLLREHLPSLKIRVVNVVDLMKLQPHVRASERALRRGLRRALHARPAGHLRVPRLSVAHPSAHLPADEPRQHPRARLQGRGNDDHAVRHDGAQRPRPLPPGDGRHRPDASGPTRARPHFAPRCSTREHATSATSTSTARTCPRSGIGAGRGDLPAQRSTGPA